jgi:hypothetical protein
VRDPRFAETNDRERRNIPTSEEVAEACASGRAIAEGPAEAALLGRAQDGLQGRRPAIWRAFHEEFVAAAREEAARRTAWTNALENAFEAARARLATDFSGKRDEREFEAASRDWHERTDPFAVWGKRDPHVSHHHDAIWSLGSMLLQIAPAQGLRAIDSLPYSSLMKELLYLFCQEDRALIESLIEAAPPVFDDQGQWRPERSVTALLVIELITKHAEALHGAVSRPIHLFLDEERRLAARQASDDLEKHELPSWMCHAFGLVLRRPDGVGIALGYLAQLSRERLLGRGQTPPEKDHWRAGDATLVALTAALARASVGVAQARDAWTAAEQRAHAAEEGPAKRTSVRPRSARGKNDAESEGARSLRTEGLPFLHGAAVLLGDAATASGRDLALFWSWLEELLVGRDPGLSLIHHGTSLSEVPQRLGFLLSRLPNPDALLRAAYGKLEPQRRRALFAHRYEELYHDLESVFLLRVGLNAAVNWFDWVKDGEQADAAREFFFWIHEAASRLWLTAVLDTGETKRQILVVCYAFMPFLFGERLGDALKRSIPAIANDPRVLTEACVNLRRNGIEAERLRGIIAEAGAELNGALRDVHQWSLLTGRVDAFPEHLRKLASELRVSLDAPESS